MPSRNEYNKVPLHYLLMRISQIEGLSIAREKEASVTAGPRYCERMDELYDWCYSSQII